MKRLFTFTIVAVFTFATSCSQTTNNEAKINLDAQGPQIEFENLEHDYGTINQSADGSCEFKFKNTGTEALVLTNVKSSCGCTVPNWPKEAIAPGSSSTIKVVYNTRNAGPISKSITVYTNASETPIVLRIKGNVLAAAAAEGPAPSTGTN